MAVVPWGAGGGGVTMHDSVVDSFMMRQRELTG